MGERDDNPPSEPDNLVVQAEFTTAESPSEVLVRLLAVAEDVEPTALPPLYDAIDPEALESLFAAPGTAGEADLSVEFAASGYRVHVTNDGSIVLLADGGSD
jgi:hypothetical protein